MAVFFTHSVSFLLKAVILPNFEIIMRSYYQIFDTTKEGRNAFIKQTTCLNMCIKIPQILLLIAAA